MKNKSIWNKSFIAIFMVALFQTMAQFIAHTLVPKYADALGATASIIGLISGLYAGTALAFRPITSPAYDIFNKKDILTVALGITSLSFVVFFLSDSLPLIVVGRAIQGLGIGVAGPMGLSIVASALPREVYSKGVSMYTITQAFGQAIGPSIGLELSKSIGYQKTFLCSAALMLVAMGLTRFCSDTPVAEDRHYRVGFKSVFSKDAIPGAVIILFTGMPYASISAMMTIYGGLLNIDKIGLYFTFYAIGLLVFKPLLGGFADKYGFVKVMVGSMAVYAVAFVIFGIFNWIFVGGFFKTAYKFAGPFVRFIIVAFVIIFLAEAVHHVPGLEFMNAFGTDHMGSQLISLAAGVLIYMALTILSCRKACKDFEEIDL